ncbi:NAD(P)/FAD-dependent oxidoreductase [Oryzicola mucosus]|uniref:NADH:ubiquinone reductase (non-electrogenic) n=1 Tax=Oryzicola mucosus TaxID=2767425 RepID=A0A8J6PRW7_9HYPH|nr:NAD(P)/FAD-dependent oxidoreductase [Oryzicola mucosus]MBD0417225.1 NAD(P)/FAD-dependent oxidoreductase [Oryzicola mucosus]
MSGVVIVGAGFGGLEVARALGKADIGATVIDRHNHHVFQPLLYQVATAALSATDIAEPIRKVLRDYPSIQVLYGRVVDIDLTARRVSLDDGSQITFDTLVLAAGAVPSYFGRTDWADFAPGLKTIEDARKLRSSLLRCFELAERSSDAAEQARLMTIAVIGGGPTGVEMAGSIAELSRHTLTRDFRNVRPGTTRVILIEAGDRMLGGFDARLSDYARQRLKKLGVEIRTRQRVEAIDATSITVSGETIPVGAVVWAAGVMASDLAAKTGGELDRGGRVRVDRYLRVKGHENIFALGDMALCLDDGGNPLPGLAQVAKQQGIYLGRALTAKPSDTVPIEAFVYRSRGNTAIIGRHAAVFESSSFRLKGWVAWMTWAVVHVYLLVGFQHRVQVALQWLWRYLTYERGARLIVEDATESSHKEPVAAQTSTSLKD